MEAATVPAAGATSPDNARAQREKATPAKSRAHGRDEKEYLVFEVDGPEWTPEAKIKFVAMVPAGSPKDARWGAVDKTERLQGPVKVKAGEEGGVYMVAVAARNATIELTREEIVESSVRK